MCSLTVPFSPHFTTDRRGDRNKHDRRPTPTATTPSGPHAGTGVTPIGADRRRTGDPEPPRHVPSGGDPHTRPRPDRLRTDRLPGEEPDGRVGICEIEAVVDAIETENGGQHGRPFGDLPTAPGSGASTPGQFLSLDDLTRTQQHGAGFTVGESYDIGTEVHAVDEIHIEVPGRAPHHLVSRGAAAIAVRRRIVESPIDRKSVV